MENIVVTTCATEARACECLGASRWRNVITAEVFSIIKIFSANASLAYRKIARFVVTTIVAAIAN